MNRVNPWRFKKEEVDGNTPSRGDGMSKEEEIVLRQKTCVFIRELGLQLTPKLQMRTTIATACIFFQRFYVRHSFKKHDHHVVALTCLFLAAKTEDEPRKLKKVAEKYHTLMQQKQNKTPIQLLNEETYFFYKSKVCIYERIVLQTLSFDLNVVHPHKIMIKMCKALTRTGALSRAKGRDFAQHTFNFLNDSVRTTVALVYSPNTLAASAVYLAFKYFEMPDITKKREKEEDGKENGEEEEEEEEEENEYQKEMRENAPDIRDIAIQLVDMYFRDPKIQNEDTKMVTFKRVQCEIKSEKEIASSSNNRDITKETTTNKEKEEADPDKAIKRDAKKVLDGGSPRKQRRVE